MREEKRVEITSSPVAVATAEDIYRRLVRPSALRFQLPTEDVRRRDSLSYKAMNLIPFEKEEEKTKKKKKLEDYMDPGLLSEISAKISRAKNIPAMKKKPIMVNNDFESSASVISRIIRIRFTKTKKKKKDNLALLRFGISTKSL